MNMGGTAAVESDPHGGHRATTQARGTTCRHCAAPLDIVLADLGHSPIANDLITADRVNDPEATYPLAVRVCGNCWLAQADDVLPADAIFRADYTYFSSHSTTWLAHAKAYVDMVIDRFGLTADSKVVEVACLSSVLCVVLAQRTHQDEGDDAGQKDDHHEGVEDREPVDLCAAGEPGRWSGPMGAGQVLCCARWARRPGARKSRSRGSGRSGGGRGYLSLTTPPST